MSENKRYYFLQLPEDFFQSKRIKKLRKLAGGDTFTIVYLKMQLKAMNNNGILCYEELETDIAEEIAIDIDEDPDNVRVTMDYLSRCGLLEIRDNGDCYLPYAEVNVGSITASSLRSRKSRDSKGVAMQQDCNTIATNCNGDIDIDKDTEKDTDIHKKKKKKSANALSLEEEETLIRMRFPQQAIVDILLEWIAYKEERGDDYSSRGFKSLLTQVENKIKERDINAVCDDIINSMSREWQGISWDKYYFKNKNASQDTTNKAYDAWKEN